MYVATGVHIVLYIIFAWIREVVMVVDVAVAVAVTVVMTKVMGTKVTATEYIAVGRLGCDIARIVISGYLGEKLAPLCRGKGKVGQGWGR